MRRREANLFRPGIVLQGQLSVQPLQLRGGCGFRGGALGGAAEGIWRPRQECRAADGATRAGEVHLLAALVTVSRCSLTTLDSWRSSALSSAGVLASAIADHLPALVARVIGVACGSLAGAGVAYAAVESCSAIRVSRRKRRRWLRLYGTGPAGGPRSAPGRSTRRASSAGSARNAVQASP